MRRWHFALVLLAALLPHLGALSAGFAYDDHSTVLENTVVQDGRLSEAFAHGWPRATRALSLALDHALFGEDPAGYHAQSLAWHALCSALAYVLLARLGLPALAALFGALLFAVHPAHVEAVTSVANRKELLHTAFSLGALLGWMRALDARGRARAGWVAASAALWGAALLSKQVAVAVPLIAAAYELLLRRPEERILLRRPGWVLCAGAAGALLLGVFLARALDLTHLDRIETFAGYAGEPTWAAAVLTSARAFWQSVALFFWPAGLCPDHVIDLSRSIAEPATAAAWLGVALLAAAGWRLRRKQPLATFALAWIALAWLPVSNLVPSAYLVADRYLYFPSIGLCVGAALAAARAFAWARRAWPQAAPAGAAAVATVLVALLSAATVAETRHWRTEEALWRHATACEPRSWRAHNNVGVFELQAGSPERARAHFDSALALRPDLSAARYNRANALLAMGRLEEAVRDYDHAIQQAPERAEPYYNRGNALYQLGRPADALADYDRALGRDPDRPDFLVNRGRARLALGELSGAVADWERALELDPRNAAAHYNLATVQRMRGDEVQARQHLRAAARLGVREAAEALAGDGARP